MFKRPLNTSKFGWFNTLRTYLRGQELSVLSQLRSQNVANVITLGGLAKNDDFLDQILQALDGRGLLTGIRTLQQNIDSLVNASSRDVAQQGSTTNYVSGLPYLVDVATYFKSFFSL